jgi:hypothetical protein
MARETAHTRDERSADRLSATRCELRFMPPPAWVTAPLFCGWRLDLSLDAKHRRSERMDDRYATCFGKQSPHGRA